MTRCGNHRVLAAVVLLLFLGMTLAPAAGTLELSRNRMGTVQPTPHTMAGNGLPPPLAIDMPLEEAMCRRMSVREFTDQQVSEEHLSTILWHACGRRSDGSRTFPGFGERHACELYVLLEDAAYRYDAADHALDMYKEGDYRSSVGWQYMAPVVLCLVWNTTHAGEHVASAQLGAAFQNIAWTATALDLGTVVTGEAPSPINTELGVPATEKGMIVMPLGHPVHGYDFRHRPWWLSRQPRPTIGDMSLTTALRQRDETSTLTGMLTGQEQSQLTWSSYGMSLYIDRSRQEKNPVVRHRTVPSAHGYYPFEIYVATENGIYRYHPNLLVEFNWYITLAPVDMLGIPVVTGMQRIARGDHRGDIAAACDEAVETAPLSVITVLNVDSTRPAWYDDLSGSFIRYIWHMEAGAAMYNVQLEATAMELSSNVFAVTDDSAIMNAIGLSGDYDPMYVAAVGE
ncbi:MAG: nitroreductase family protein [Thermoplasmatota archaeon]